MLNYEEELKKFKPSLDVDEVENAIYNQDLTDVIDLMKDLVRPGHKPVRTEGKDTNELYELRCPPWTFHVLSQLWEKCTAAKKAEHLSNLYYNQGLEKAQIRDLSGAEDLLLRSLKFNKLNIPARNLLGLVYYEMGEAVSALSEWIISKNFQRKDNLASDYIERLQKRPTSWIPLT